MSNDESVESLTNQQKLGRLKTYRKNVNWEVEAERHEFLRKIYPLIDRWQDPFPNLRKIFRAEEINWLLLDCVYNHNSEKIDRAFSRFLNFVLKTRYKEKPEITKDGKPLLHRTTPVHVAARFQSFENYFLVQALFDIYDNSTVNYTDDFGHTLFQVACEFGCDEVIEKFLELGQDPNCLLDKSSSFDPPLYLALKQGRKMMIELLRRMDFDPNLANRDGSTPLHMISQNPVYAYKLAETLFKLERKKNVLERFTTSLRTFFKKKLSLEELNNDKYLPVRVDSLDKLGNTPLHVAASCDRREMVDFLLRNGADPNVANAEGSTALHLLFKRPHYFGFGTVDRFFKICEKKQQLVKVDAKDKLGRTPLQWAVANLWSDCIDILLKRGADLSSFVFPTESYFGERCKSVPLDFDTYRLRFAASALATVERIAIAGYRLERSHILTIMKFFAQWGLFQNTVDLEKTDWYDEGWKRAVHQTGHNPKEIMVNPSVSLYDLTRLRPDEAEKLVTFTDWVKLAHDYWSKPFLFGDCGLPCGSHLCEKVARGFFRHWALDPFLELTRYRLPVEMCEMIIVHLKNEDLYNICLAATL